VHETSAGLTAKLNLAGKPCTAFGQDIQNLTIEVSYESKTRSALSLPRSPLRSHLPATRLHVNIYDTAKQQFTVPTTVITPPGTEKGSTKAGADLVFNYQPAPFAFWITRRADPKAAPLFDTRTSSLPKTPLPPVSPDNATALDGFPLVFEDSYLQVCSDDL
jgi:alpha-glucosidase